MQISLKILEKRGKISYIGVYAHKDFLFLRMYTATHVAHLFIKKALSKASPTKRYSASFTPVGTTLNRILIGL